MHFISDALQASVAQSVEYPLRGMGGHGFDPRPRLPKSLNSSLGTQTCVVELGLVVVSCQLLGA